MNEENSIFALINGQIDEGLKQGKDSVPVCLLFGFSMNFNVEIGYNYQEKDGKSIVDKTIPYDLGKASLIWAGEISDAWIDSSSGKFIISFHIPWRKHV